MATGFDVLFAELRQNCLGVGHARASTRQQQPLLLDQNRRVRQRPMKDDAVDNPPGQQSICGRPQGTENGNDENENDVNNINDGSTPQLALRLDYIRSLRKQRKRHGCATIVQLRQRAKAFGLRSQQVIDRTALQDVGFHRRLEQQSATVTRRVQELLFECAAEIAKVQLQTKLLSVSSSSVYERQAQALDLERLWSHLLSRVEEDSLSAIRSNIVSSFNDETQFATCSAAAQDMIAQTIRAQRPASSSSSSSSTSSTTALVDDVAPSSKLCPEHASASYVPKRERDTCDACKALATTKATATASAGLAPSSSASTTSVQVQLIARMRCGRTSATSKNAADGSTSGIRRPRSARGSNANEGGGRSSTSHRVAVGREAAASALDWMARRAGIRMTDRNGGSSGYSHRPYFRRQPHGTKRFTALPATAFVNARCVEWLLPALLHRQLLSSSSSSSPYGLCAHAFLASPRVYICLEEYAASRRGDAHRIHDGSHIEGGKDEEDNGTAALLSSTADARQLTNRLTDMYCGRDADKATVHLADWKHSQALTMTGTLGRHRENVPKCAECAEAAQTISEDNDEVDGGNDESACACLSARRMLACHYPDVVQARVRPDAPPLHFAPATVLSLLDSSHTAALLSTDDSKALGSMYGVSVSSLLPLDEEEHADNNNNSRESKSVNDKVASHCGQPTTLSRLCVLVRHAPNAPPTMVELPAAAAHDLVHTYLVRGNVVETRRPPSAAPSGRTAVAIPSSVLSTKKGKASNLSRSFSEAPSNSQVDATTGKSSSSSSSPLGSTTALVLRPGTPRANATLLWAGVYASLHSAAESSAPLGTTCDVGFALLPASILHATGALPSSSSSSSLSSSSIGKGGTAQTRNGWPRPERSSSQKRAASLSKKGNHGGQTGTGAEDELLAIVFTSVTSSTSPDPRPDPRTTPGATSAMAPTTCQSLCAWRSCLADAVATRHVALRENSVSKYPVCHHHDGVLDRLSQSAGGLQEAKRHLCKNRSLVAASKGGKAGAKQKAAAAEAAKQLARTPKSLRQIVAGSSLVNELQTGKLASTIVGFCAKAAHAARPKRQQTPTAPLSQNGKCHSNTHWQRLAQRYAVSDGSALLEALRCELGAVQREIGLMRKIAFVEHKVVMELTALEQLGVFPEDELVAIRHQFQELSVYRSQLLEAQELDDEASASMSAKTQTRDEHSARQLRKSGSGSSARGTQPPGVSRGKAIIPRSKLLLLHFHDVVRNSLGGESLTNLRDQNHTCNNAEESESGLEDDAAADVVGVDTGVTASGRDDGNARVDMTHLELEFSLRKLYILSRKRSTLEASGKERNAAEAGSPKATASLAHVGLPVIPGSQSANSSSSNNNNNNKSLDSVGMERSRPTGNRNRVQQRLRDARELSATIYEHGAWNR